MVPSAISSPVSPASRSSATPEEILQSLRRQKRRRTHQGPVLSNTPHAGEQAETEPSPSKSRLGGAAWRNGNATQSQRLGSSPGTIGGLVTHQRIATLNSNSTRLTSLRRERSLGVGRERQRAEPASQGNASRIVAHPAPVAQRHQQLTLSNVTSAKSVRARVVKRYRPIVPHSSILTEQQLTEVKDCRCLFFWLFWLFSFEFEFVSVSGGKQTFAFRRQGVPGFGPAWGCSQVPRHSVWPAQMLFSSCLLLFQLPRSPPAKLEVAGWAGRLFPLSPTSRRRGLRWHC